MLFSKTSCQNVGGGSEKCIVIAHECSGLTYSSYNFYIREIFTKYAVTIFLGHKVHDSYEDRQHYYKVYYLVL